MENINAYAVKSLVALVLLSMLAPFPGVAQNATPVSETPTPIEVVADPDATVIEENSQTSTPEVTAEVAPSGQRMSVMDVAPPIVTLFGSTEPATVLVNVTVTPEKPSGSEIASFRNASCTGNPVFNWSGGLNTRSYASKTVYFQARWKDDDSTRGNCLAVTWERVSVPVLDSEACGDNNDIVTLPKAQPGISFTDTGWVNNTRTITLAETDDYRFMDGQRTVFEFEDEGPCETGAPIPPVQTEICGTNNDVISFPSDQPEGVVVIQNESWSEDSTSGVSFSAEEGYFLPAGTKTEYTFSGAGPCETNAPIPPVQTEICGTNNDVVSFPSDQPANVFVTQSDSWNEDSKWTVTFTAAEHYKLPVGTETEYAFTDSAIPCPTDAPAPPVQSAVCGTDNDLITIPDEEPEGITLESDSGWKNNTRTITFAVAPDFQTDGPTTFTFNDAADPCPVPTMRVTIQLQTSDGESITGSPWLLYAPLVAQLPITDPYRDGTVGPDNQIVLENLVAGQYRMVVIPDGYEAIDETFSIIDGEDNQIISLQAPAIQDPDETPTPSPVETVEPAPTEFDTGTPSPPATVESSVVSTEAIVSGLPNTGSGAGITGISYLAGLILIVAGIGAITRRAAR